MRKSEQDRRNMTEEDGLQIEKKDPLALYIAGFLSIGLPCLLVILVILGVTMLLFGLWG